MSNVEIISPVQEYEFIEGFRELSDESHFWFRGRFEAFLRELIDLNIPTDADWKVLDVGCGTGVLRKQVESVTPWTVDVTDLDLEGLKLAQNGRGRTMYYDINKREESMKESYDAILLFDVIEHVKDTRTFVESLLFHVKRGGYIFINVPALQLLFCRYDELQGHFRRYNKSSIANEFDKLSTDIRDIRYWGFTNIPLVLLRKIWCVTLGRQKSDEEVFKKGFKPPNRLINKALSTTMNLELGILPKAPVGTSLLAVFQKR